MIGVRTSSLYTAASGGIRLAVGIASAPLLVRLLGVREFGIWSVVNAMLLLAALTEFGITVAFTNELARDNARKDWDLAGRTAATSLAITTALGLVTSVIIFFAAPYLAQWLFPELADRSAGLATIRVLSWIVLPRFWQLWASAASAALYRYDLQTAVELPVGLAIQAGSVLAALVWPEPVAVAAWQLLVTVAACAGHAAVLRRVWPPLANRWSWSPESARRLWSFGLAQQVNAVGATLFNQADRIIVNGVLGPTAAGLYAAATSIANKVVEVPYMFLKVLPPAVTAAHAVGNYDRLRNLYLQGIRANGVITLLGVTGVLFWTEPIARIMVGPGFAAQEVPVLQVMAVIYAMHGLCCTSSWFGLGLGRPGVLARWSLIGGVLMCVTMRLGGAWYGLTGAAWANASFLVTALITVEVAPMIGIGIRAAGRAFAPFVLASFSTWALCASPIYQPLPIWGKAIAFCILEPLILLSAAGWAAAKDLWMTSLPGLRVALAGKQS
jgi:O-antigen/teichoic acid export membrane protein